MSDEPVEGTNEGSGDDGQFLGEDLAKLVTLAQELRTLGGGNALDDNAAQDILVARLGAKPGLPHRWSDGDQQDEDSAGNVRARDIAEVIIDSLPADMRTQGVLDAIDLRPYLKALDGKTIVKRIGGAGFGMEDANKAKIDTTWLQDQQQKALEAAANAMTTGSSLPGGETKQRLDVVLADPGMTVGIAVMQKPEVQASLAGDVEWDPNGKSRVVNGSFPEDEYRQMVVNDIWTLEQLVLEQEQATSRGQEGSFRVDVGLTGRGVDDPTAPARQYGGAGGISAKNAMSYLTTLTPSQIENMQLKLANAGYFDKIEGGAFYEKGNPHDPVTRAAWNMLLKDQIKTGRSAPALLVDGIRDYRKKVTQARLDGIRAIDPSYNNFEADSYAQSMIGRSLTSQELDELNQFVVGLRRRRAGYVQGAEGNPADRGLQGEVGYTDDDLKQYVARTTAYESSVREQAARFYQMGKMSE